MTQRCSPFRWDDQLQPSGTNCTANIQTKSVHVCDCMCVVIVQNWETNRSWGPAHLLLHQSSQDWKQFTRAPRYGVSVEPLHNGCSSMVTLLGYLLLSKTSAAFLLLTPTFSSLRMSVATVSVPCCTVQRVELLLLLQKCGANLLQSSSHHRTQRTWRRTN